MKHRELILYKDIALRVAEMSYATRRKVGAVLIKDGNILSFGWNGTPSGVDNNCERKDYYHFSQEYHDDEIQAVYPHANEHGYYQLVTLDTVLHAELNCILKCAKEGRSTKDATLILTLSPCLHCAKLVLQSGVKEVFYVKEYRDTTGINFLNQNNVICLPIN